MTVILDLLPLVVVLGLASMRYRRITGLRHALAEGMLLTAALLVAVVELVSRAGALTAPVLRSIWAMLALLALLAALWRARRAPAHLRELRSGLVARLRPSVWLAAARRHPLQAGLLAALLVLLGGELVVALAAVPNNWDSMTYHLPRVAHWIHDGRVGLYPTENERQLYMAPGSEYVLLTGKLLAGTDRLLNLVQWAASVGVCALASLVARQLGAGRTGQLVAALFVGTAPIVVLEATSTQNDLITAAWVLSFVSVTVRLCRDRRPNPRRLLTSAVFGGLALGLAALTKTTGYVFLAPFGLIWLGAAIRASRRMRPAAVTEATTGGDGSRRRAAGHGERRRVVVARWSARWPVVTVVLLLLTVLLNLGPGLSLQATYGSPLGPTAAVAEHGMQRHDPGAVGLNAWRLLGSNMLLPVPRFDHAIGRADDSLARAAGVSTYDEQVSFGGEPYSTYFKLAEDYAPNPWQAMLIPIVLLLVLLRPRSNATARIYALGWVLAILVMAATVKWQPWVTRLTLPSLALAGALVPIAFAPPNIPGRVRRLKLRPGAAAVAVLGCAVLFLTGVYALVTGMPRPLLGHRSLPSVLVQSSEQHQFASRPEIGPSMVRTAAALNRAGVKRLGLVDEGDSWEYPWWRYLGGPRRAFVTNVDSEVPGHPAPKVSDLQAVVCQQRSGCRNAVPRGWRYFSYGTFTAAVPPPTTLTGGRSVPPFTPVERRARHMPGLNPPEAAQIS